MDSLLFSNFNFTYLMPFCWTSKCKFRKYAGVLNEFILHLRVLVVQLFPKSWNIIVLGNRTHQCNDDYNSNFIYTANQILQNAIIDLCNRLLKTRSDATNLSFCLQTIESDLASVGCSSARSSCVSSYFCRLKICMCLVVISHGHESPCIMHAFSFDIQP